MFNKNQREESFTVTNIFFSRKTLLVHLNNCFEDSIAKQELFLNN